MTPEDTTALANTLLDLLPQTQCTKCGYPNCRAYAQAMAAGEAQHNQCPPGGQEGIARLSKALHRPIVPLNLEQGVERPRPVAHIDETRCIGCTLCIQACPVDAIVGAPKHMHTVIASDCTGCDLCIAPCPVDCISLLPITGTATGWAAWSIEEANRARLHYAQHTERLERLQKRTQKPFKPERAVANTTLPSDQSTASDTFAPDPVHTAANHSQPLTQPPSTHKQALLQAILKRVERKN